MLYLIEAKAIEDIGAMAIDQQISFMQDVIIPTYKIITEGERNKKNTGGMLAGRKAWVIIADFPNHEEANKWVMSLPIWPVYTFKIKPLVTFQSQMDAVSKLVQDLKSKQKK